MSCSARLPIYILVAGTFFAAHAGLVMTGLYVLGVLLAVVTARLMRRFMFPVDETPFVMELPPYRIPTWKTTLSHMWDKCAQYLRKMGGMILIASVVVWFLSYYPRTEQSDMKTSAHYENSYLGQLGKGCEPIFSPLGLEWKASVALLSGLPAKEIVISTLGVLYADTTLNPLDTDDVAEPGMEDEFIMSTEDASGATLSARLLASGDFTTASAMSFLVFILLYFPCIATIAAIGSEAGWKWAAVAVAYDTALAWVAAWATYNLMMWL